MAPVLVCPECQTKHPLDSIGPRSAFPCTGCGRTLKVPGAAIGAAIGAVAEGRPPDSPPANSRAPEPDFGVTNAVSAAAPAFDTAPPIAPPVALATAAAAPVTGPALGMPNSTARADRLPDLVPNRFIRFALWIVAVPLAFFVVFTLARAFGLLSTNDVTDVALAEGWRRFMPIVRLLPFVALATAGFVHGGVFAITRFRERRRQGVGAPDSGAKPAAASKPAAAWRPRQSSGKGA